MLALFSNVLLAVFFSSLLQNDICPLLINYSFLIFFWGGGRGGGQMTERHSMKCLYQFPFYIYIKSGGNIVCSWS